MEIIRTAWDSSRWDINWRIRSGVARSRRWTSWCWLVGIKKSSTACTFTIRLGQMTEVVLWLFTRASSPRATRKRNSAWVWRVRYWLWFDGRGSSWSRSAGGLWAHSWDRWKNRDFCAIPELLWSASSWLGTAEVPRQGLVRFFD